jgi:hypothetical protein
MTASHCSIKETYEGPYPPTPFGSNPAAPAYCYYGSRQPRLATKTPTTSPNKGDAVLHWAGRGVAWPRPLLPLLLLLLRLPIGYDTLLGKEVVDPRCGCVGPRAAVRKEGGGRSTCPGPSPGR